MEIFLFSFKRRNLKILFFSLRLVFGFLWVLDGFREGDGWMRGIVSLLFVFFFFNLRMGNLCGKWFAMSRQRDLC